MPLFGSVGDFRPGQRVLAPWIGRPKFMQASKLRVTILDHIVTTDRSWQRTRAPWDRTRYYVQIGWPKEQQGQKIQAGEISGLGEGEKLEEFESGIKLRLLIKYDCVLQFSGYTALMAVDEQGNPSRVSRLISAPNKTVKVPFAKGTGQNGTSWLALMDTLAGIKTYGKITQIEPVSPASLQRRRRAEALCMILYPQKNTTR